ncbi:protein-S-isoprenylcysteine methyltransferase [Altericroceibacterium spongiae]|uniref:Protein-S-isoprenylcysteine methyltransferase n=1 Tax=Altericroceibacterium spongiae TaxID=2320269 RepID=A0A420EKP1_9SPHN|nr:protein-S-isoprenylcysteine methyltransferase [Altericroceibacterium spongiae]
MSWAVGCAGLTTLLGWIVVCRAWPHIADALALSGPHRPMNGPLSALTAMALAGLAMGLWSVLIEKVHRRPSTGIDWNNPRPLSAIAEISVTKLAGLWATWAVIGMLYCLARWYWQGQYLFAMDVLATAAIPLFLLSIPYVLWLDRVTIEPRDHSWHFGAMLIGREPWDRAQVAKHSRAWIIKGFFGAFMISILPPGFAFIVNVPLSEIWGHPVRFGQTLFQLLFVIDVQIGTVGYLLTLRPLDAHIRSGNPFVAGWLAALLCYPPFVNGLLGPGGAIAYEVNTADWGFWLHNHTALAWIWAGGLGLLTAIYAWATVAFGIRFSNLTYRGVITNGPYAFSRHPAYLSKNLFWWGSVLPFFVTSGNPVDIVRNCFFLGCVNAIYFWRAKTEEAHLLREDMKYRAYHQWMAQHGAITSRLNRLARLLTRHRAGLSSSGT